MASLANNSKDEKEQMNIAHEKLTFLLNKATSPNAMEKILDEYYNHGNITIHFVKTLQLHIDLCVKRRDQIRKKHGQASPFWIYINWTTIFWMKS